MFYTAKCYWPGVTRNELEKAAARVLRQPEQKAESGGSPTYLGLILFPDDELVLCMFEARSPAAVKHASERASIPCERIMATVWLPPLDANADLFVTRTNGTETRRVTRSNPWDSAPDRDLR